jgi:hypothetical protein
VDSNVRVQRKRVAVERLVAKALDCLGSRLDVIVDELGLAVASKTIKPKPSGGGLHVCIAVVYAGAHLEATGQVFAIGPLHITLLASIADLQSATTYLLKERKVGSNEVLSLSYVSSLFPSPCCLMTPI